MLGLTGTIAIGIFFILVLTSVFAYDTYHNIKLLRRKNDE